MPWVLPHTVHVVHHDTSGAALLDERSGRWYHLSRPGGRLLKAILAGADPEEAAAEAAVPGDPARSARAFLALFHDLRAAGLLIPRSDGSPHPGRPGPGPTGRPTGGLTTRLAGTITARLTGRATGRTRR
ncbi:hypothetical protein [Streptomyces sp. NPDC004783]|uniref:hypothetical protein n=1 Tax=Streptomyces sp. NPDC004783 TaxID=3154459 RepID=UPI0033A7DB38